MASYNPQEFFPVLNEVGQVIGKATRMNCHDGSKLLHPVVHLHVISSDGKLFLQKRPTHKDIQPDKWDTAVGGHVDYGEEIEIALRRESLEEIGITNFDPQLLCSYIFESEREKEWVNCYMCHYDGPFNIAKDEIDDARFWSLSEIETSMGKDIFTPNFEQEFFRIKLAELLSN